MISMIQSLVKKAPSNAIIHMADPDRPIYYLGKAEDLKTSSDPNTLYIGSFSDELLSYKIHGTSLLLLVDSGKPPEFPSNCNTIFVNRTEDIDMLAAQMLSTMNSFVKYSRINEELLSIVRDGGSMQKLLNYGCSLLGNPLLLVDISFGYVASAGTGDLSSQAIWDYTIEHGVMPSDYLAQIMVAEAKYLESDSGLPEIIVTEPDENNASRSFSVKIIYKNTVYGYLKVMERDSAFTEFDQDVFIMLGKYVGIMTDTMLQLYNYNSDQAENLLASMVTGKTDLKQGADALLTLSPVKFYKNMYIISICFNSPPDPEDHIYYTHRRLKRFFPKNIVSIVNDSFVVLYDSQQDELPFKNSSDASFVNMLREMNCCANISLVFHSLETVNSCFGQLRFCREYRKLVSSEETLLYYEDIYEYQMILALRDQLDLRSLIHPAIRKLTDYDDRTGGELTRTLFAYVENNESISATSAALFFHYNTVKHRIGKIVEITGLDFDDKDEMFRIMLSKKILTLLERSSKE